MSNLEKQIKEQVGAVVLLKAKLKERILSLPDNPDIKRLEGGAFTITASQLFGKKNPTRIMSPEFFDFKSQHANICEIIDHSTIDTLYQKLITIVKEGQVKVVSGRSSHTFKFHPDVIKALDTVLKEEL